MLAALLGAMLPPCSSPKQRLGAMLAALLVAVALPAAVAAPATTCSAAAYLNNTDFHDGQGLGNGPGKDAADCCAQCSSAAWAAKGCKFFTLSMGTCWFKKDDSGRRYIAGAVSGGISGAPLGPPPPAPPKAACPDPSKINIACVGDSITFGAHSSGGQNYPAQLQGMLDKKYPGKYCTVKLGTCGATMQRPPFGDAPYWSTREFATWTDPKNVKLWDKVVIMLGTNDAKDACPAEHCPASFGCGNASFCESNHPGSCCNWPHAGQTNWTQDCTDLDCPFAKTYAEMITLARSMGKQPAGPDIFLAIPPPLSECWPFPCVFMRRRVSSSARLLPHPPG
jgi:lysophospholipase L1-like esterase